jgi:hypothetical protein
MSKASKPKAAHAAAKKRKSEPVQAAAAAAKDHVWITATGDHIPVKDMPTAHIQNCINCLLGKGILNIPAGYLGGKELWLDIFRAELQARLEQALSGSASDSDSDDEDKPRYSDGEGDFISA